MIRQRPRCRSLSSRFQACGGSLLWPGCLGMFPAAVKLSQVNQGSLEMYARAAANPFQNEEAAPFCSRELRWGHNTGGDGNRSAWLAYCC